ncbi:MAG TPA: efflux RND transporter periplasmic adaptor subunit [Acidobacteriota bacterium]|nr:efflux RND transporter periplasmic adaptor subunit [Acidobacteriota bacterium]
MRKKSILILMVIIFLLLGSCTEKEAGPIKAAAVVDGDVVTVKTLVGGRADQCNIREGAPVYKDDVLMEVDAEKLLIQMQGLDIKEKEIRINKKKLESRKDLLNSNLGYWEDQVKRLERLAQKESVSKDDLRKAELKLKEIQTSILEVKQSLNELGIQEESLKNQREHLKLQIKDYTVTSPVTGFILERFVSSQETVFPGSAIADVLDLDSLFVETFLEEKELSRLELGQEVIILLDGESTEFKGEIINFGREAEFSPKYIISEKERKSLLFKVKIRIKENKEKFKLGMPVTVIFYK